MCHFALNFAVCCLAPGNAQTRKKSSARSAPSALCDKKPITPMTLATPCQKILAMPLDTA